MEIKTAGRMLQIKICRDSGGAVVFSSKLPPPVIKAIFFLFKKQYVIV
jgi:hypothetical protein